MRLVVSFNLIIATPRIEFRSALKNPNSDAKIPAQKLYNWLIKPLEADLTMAYRTIQ
jgi:CHAT domain-containing protein